MTTKKFRLISALMAALMVLGSLTVVPAFAADLNDHVITWYDFEGDDDATRLADKATAGSTKKSATVTGSGVKLENGTAVVPKEADNYLSLDDADFADLAGKTVFVRLKGAKLEATTNSTVMFINHAVKGDLGRLILWNDNATTGDAHMRMWITPNPLTAKLDNGKMDNPLVPADTYVNYAVTYAYEGEKLTATSYYSLDGVDYKAVSHTVGEGVGALSCASIILGKNKNCAAQDRTLTFDDFRVYDKVLTPDEIKTIADDVPTVAAPAVKEDLSDEVITWFDFNGETEEERMADKAQAGDALDTLGTLFGDGVKLENGTLYVPSTENHYVAIPVTADTTDFNGKTVYMRVKMEGSGQPYTDYAGDFFEIPKVMRAFPNQTSVIYGSNVQVPITSRAMCVTGNKIDTSATTPTFFYDDVTKYLHYAFTCNLDASGELTADVYLSMDGENYTKVSGAWSGVTDKLQPLTDGKNTDIILGKTFGARTKDRDTSYTFDDFRVYGRALTDDEIKNIADDVPPPAPPVPPTADELNANVVTWFDFEGTGDEALKDKAPAGNVKDTLTVTGDKVKIENGTAFVHGDGGNVLTITKSEDMADLNGKSIYIKVKASATSSYVNTEGNGSTFFKIQTSSSDYVTRALLHFPEVSPATNPKTYDANRVCLQTWMTPSGVSALKVDARSTAYDATDYIYFVQTFEFNGTDYVSKVYISNDGVHYRDYSVNSNAVSSLSYTDIFLGKDAPSGAANRNRSFEYDEFRIYNKVLTTLDLGVLASQTPPAGEGEVTVMTNQHQFLWPVIRKINIAETANGTVTSSRARTFAGQTVVLTVTPDAGYELDTLTVTGKNGYVIKLKDLGEGKYSFLMPGAIPQITATFKSTGAVAPETPDTPATPETPAEDKYAANLVTWYNFEGETIEEQLADKATAGTDAIAAVLNGNVEIKDGAAYVSAATEDGYISLEADNDNMDLNGKTVFLKFKVLGTDQHEKNYGPDFLNIKGLFRTFIEGSKISDLGLRIERMWLPDNKSWVQNYSSSFGFEEGQYIYAAYTFEYSESGTLKLNAYLSTDGVKYQRTTGSKDNFASLEWTAFEIGRGNTRCRDYIFDDIRIYDIVLTDADLAKLGA